MGSLLAWVVLGRVPGPASRGRCAPCHPASPDSWGAAGSRGLRDGPDLPGAHVSQDPSSPGASRGRGVGSDEGVWALWQIPACINTV